MSSLLVIDWDFFTPMDEVGPNWPLYDWGHNENGSMALLFKVAIWPTRAAAFIRNNMPLPTTSGEENGFWDRFNITDDATLFYADSNVFAFDEGISPGVSEIWLYDAHHDCGYRGDETLDLIQNQGRVDCENWTIGYHLLNALQGSAFHVRYPKWKTYAFDVEPEPALKIDRQFDNENNAPDTEFSAIFVCRSSAWTPPWLDTQFEEFVQSAPVDQLDCIDPEGDLPVRPFDMKEVEETNEVFQQMMQIHADRVRTAENVQGRIQSD